MTVSSPLPAPAPPHTTRPRRAARGRPAVRAVDDVRRTLLQTSVPTWAILSLHSYLIEPVRDHLSQAAVISWATLNLAFLFSMVFTLRHLPALSARRALTLMGVQAASLLAANAALSGSSVQAGLLVIVAAQVSLLLPFRQVTGWIVAQSVALLGVLHLNWQNLDAWAFSTGYLSIQLLAAASVRTAMREVRGRHRLATVVEELRATRELLNEASRKAERLDISRELHDVLGHQLTALGMHLQVGLHHLPDTHPAHAHVHTARTVSHQLLQDVRTTVRGMRDTSSCDLAGEVQALVAAAPLVVHLRFDPHFTLTCPVTSLVLRRCVQEIITNAVRHARAEQLWLTFTREGQDLRVEAFDDGRGAPDLQFGCGLLGMRERLGCVGGTLHLDSPPGRGLRYRLNVPVNAGGTVTGVPA